MIFDSDVFIAALRGDRDAAILIESDPSPFISIVSVIEVYRGANSRKEMAEFQSSLRSSDVEVLGLTAAIGDRAVVLIEDHALSTGIELGDALIAATALETGHDLATGNVRHFRSIPRLRLKAFRPQQH